MASLLPSIALLLLTLPFPSISTSTSYITRHASALYLTTPNSPTNSPTNTSTRFTASGANIYWLGLDENVIPPPSTPPAPFYAPLNASYPTRGRITEAMSTVKIMGATTVRSQTLGVSVGNPLSVMPKLGEVNEGAWESMDWAVREAGRVGLRVFAPLTDNYDYYHGGKFVFLRWRGIDIGSAGSNIDPLVQQFYTNRTIIDDFKNYIRILLTHRNQFTNLTYAEDPTIFAYETGNELGGPTFGDKDVPAVWTHEILSYVKELAPTKLTIDGTYGINAEHLNLSSVDIFSDHFYPMDVDKLSAGVELVAGTDKVYLAAEYGWTPQTQSKTPMSEFFAWIEQRQNHFWSYFGHNVPDCKTFVDHNDGLALQYGNPKNPVNYTTQISKIRQHLFKMQGIAVDETLPPAPCPGN
ncbi:glycoside hydrolase family 5 protein [Lophiostoma macrostomum CBS 122681]|uniref:mannan endo-1,4-beta-mannosidase n=1 Tax=Lophiostoma macrostomum CBS 122681 TaxID=1314788 RepID=A0A6A6TC25_9PLEO|nr:glycoside hydrolase family 5 protein [Lophiostoma macrostomum CBS 122681]